MSELIKTYGIVLNSKKHTQDAARVLEILSPNLGKFSATIKGVEKPKAKLAAAAQPFCFGEFILDRRGNFYTVRTCDVLDSFFDIAYNLDCYVLGSSMLEICSCLAQQEEENLELFELLLNSLKVMTYDKAEPTATTIKFLISVLNISGFGFNLNTCSICGKELINEKTIGLTYENGGAVCLSCSSKMDSLQITAGEYGILKNINNILLEKLGGLKFSSREALTSCLNIMLKQFYYRTGEEIKSLKKYFD